MEHNDSIFQGLILSMDLEMHYIRCYGLLHRNALYGMLLTAA